MVTGVKVGRAAHELVRDQAKELASTYRKVSNTLDGEFCANPEDEPEDQVRINHSQALDHVLSALERFAETGSFALPFDVRKFGVREAYRAARRNGTNRNDAIEQLMGHFRMSKSVVERTVRPTNKTIAAVRADEAVAPEATARTENEG